MIYEPCTPDVRHQIRSGVGEPRQIQDLYSDAKPLVFLQGPEFEGSAGASNREYYIHHYHNPQAALRTIGSLTQKPRL